MKYLKGLSLKIADFQVRLILSLVFIAVVPIFALVSRIFTKRNDKRITWGLWKLKSDTLDEVKKQF